MAGSDREWIVDELTEDGEVNRDAVIASLMEAESVGHRVGLGVIASPIRIEEARGDALIGAGEVETVTIGWRFKLVRVPLARRNAPPEVEEPLAMYDAPEIEETEPEAETVGDALAEARNGS